nr:reverse transcriptase domain-containing protein [Tanacetum cinerariifolium]
MLLVTQIDTLYNGLTLRHWDTINAAAGGTFMKKRPKECYDLIENMTAHHNHWDTSATRDDTSRTISSTTTSESPEVVRQLLMMNKDFQDMRKQIQSVKSVNPKCETCGGPHSFTECTVIGGYTQEAAYATMDNHNSGVQHSNELSNYMKINETNMRAMQNQKTTMRTKMKNDFETSMAKQHNELKNMMTSFIQMHSPSGSGSLPSNTVANPRGDLKAITTRSGVAYEGPLIPPTYFSLPKEVEHEPEVTKDKVQTTSSESTATSNLRHTSRYSYRYDDESFNRIDVIDITCEEYAQEVLRFSDSSKSGNPTPSSYPIIVTSSPSFTSFEGGDFVLEEIEACLTSDSIPSKIDDTDFDPEGDILLLEKLLHDDPSSPLPLKEINFEELKIIKSSIDDPPELELKDLPSHLEYAFWEDTNKLPIIIAKNLKDNEKAHLLKVLKSHKHVIAWKISNIKGIDPQFCTHKLLMEDDFKPTVQHQKRVNPKIHEVIKKEVIKLLDAGLIYPISDSPWGIVLGHKIFKSKIEADRVKDDVIAKLPHPTSVKGVRSFLGHAGFYHRFIQDFSKISRSMTHLLEKTPFIFSKECIEAFKILKKKLTEALILVSPDWDLPFEIMCDASDFAVGAVLEQHDALWAFRITFKTPIGCIPYKLVYRKACHLPIDLEHKTYWALKHCNIDLKSAGDHQKVQMNELNELRDQAYENSLIYKEKTKKIHDSKIKNRIFNVGDRVLLFNSRLKIFSGELKTCWAGPFIVTQVFPYGTVELSQTDGPNFK